MGLFNAMCSIGEMNNLLKETEGQLKKISDLMGSKASSIMIQQEVNHLISLYNQMGDVLENSSGARVAMYTFLGKKTRALNVLMFLKEVIMDMNNA